MMECRSGRGAAKGRLTGGQNGLHGATLGKRMRGSFEQTGSNSPVTDRGHRAGTERVGEAVGCEVEGVGALSQESEAAAAQLKKREALVPIKSHYCRLERRGAAASIDMSGCWGEEV